MQVKREIIGNFLREVPSLGCKFRCSQGYAGKVTEQWGYETRGGDADCVELVSTCLCAGADAAAQGVHGCQVF